jgi:hypothetical protein
MRSVPWSTAMGPRHGVAYVSEHPQGVYVGRRVVPRMRVSSDRAQLYHTASGGSSIDPFEGAMTWPDDSRECESPTTCSGQPHQTRGAPAVNAGLLAFEGTVRRIFGKQPSPGRQRRTYGMALYARNVGQSQQEV